jgi:argininosuccinate synthase
MGDTIIGIKGRVGFEAAAPMIIIKAHHLLESCLNQVATVLKRSTQYLVWKLVAQVKCWIRPCVILRNFWKIPSYCERKSIYYPNPTGLQ